MQDRGQSGLLAAKDRRCVLPKIFALRLAGTVAFIVGFLAFAMLFPRTRPAFRPSAVVNSLGEVVTNREYKIYLDGKELLWPLHWINGKYPRANSDRPVYNVSWHQARQYCESIGGALPTEEEWRNQVATVPNRGHEGEYFSEWTATEVKSNLAVICTHGDLDTGNRCKSWESKDNKYNDKLTFRCKQFDGNAS